jgi:hypothetical protein
MLTDTEGQGNDVNKPDFFLELLSISKLLQYLSSY